MIDDTITRDLMRIVNDRDVNQRHRNVVRRAVDVIAQLEGGEAYDPDKTDFKANFESMEEREEARLQLLEIEL